MAMGYPIRNRNEDIIQVFQKALPRCTACIRGVRHLTVQAHGTQNGLCAGCAQWGMAVDASLANGAPIASRQINVDAAFVQKYKVIRLLFQAGSALVCTFFPHIGAAPVRLPTCSSF